MSCEIKKLHKIFIKQFLLFCQLDFLLFIKEKESVNTYLGERKDIFMGQLDCPDLQQGHRDLSLAQ
jgi:hypothetical protein